MMLYIPVSSQDSLLQIHILGLNAIYNIFITPGSGWQAVECAFEEVLRGGRWRSAEECVCRGAVPLLLGIKKPAAACQKVKHRAIF